MKITLDFDGHEEREDALRAMQALDIALALDAVGGALREIYKYSEDGPEIDAAEKMRAQYYQILEDHNIVLENIIS